MSSINKGSKLIPAMKIASMRSYQERTVPKFLKKVYYILEENKYNELLSWSNDGLSLIIKKPTEFANKVLPLYFKHSNFSSFIRQLNMYKFKKRKNSHYDHIYTHEMFQSGKIDLLRNIQRRTGETNNAVPSDSQTNKSDIDVDIERIIQENMQYKRIHRLLYTQVEYIENKMKDIKNEVATLQHEQERSQENEKFLKNVLKTLTKVYGFENIAKVIQNDVEDNGELCSVDCNELNFQDHENRGEYSMINNGSVSNLQGTNSNEDGFAEKSYETSCEFQLTEQLPTNDAPQLLPKTNGFCRKGDHAEALSNIFHGENWDQLGDSANNYPSATLTKQFDNKDNNSELVFCRTSSWFLRDLSNDDLLRNKNQILCEADF